MQLRVGRTLDPTEPAEQIGERHAFGYRPTMRADFEERRTLWQQLEENNEATLGREGGGEGQRVVLKVVRAAL